MGGVIQNRQGAGVVHNTDSEFKFDLVVSLQSLFYQQHQQGGYGSRRLVLHWRNASCRQGERSEVGHLLWTSFMKDPMYNSVMTKVSFLGVISLFHTIPNLG